MIGRRINGSGWYGNPVNNEQTPDLSGQSKKLKKKTRYRRLCRYFIVSASKIDERGKRKSFISESWFLIQKNYIYAG